MRCTLAHSNRLHRRAEFIKFFDSSTVFRLSECTLFRIPNQKKEPRLGITFKARGSSVIRNKVKRQIRESMRLQFHSLGNFDYNVVIPAKKKLSRVYAEKIANCLKNELKKAVDHDSES